MRVCASRHWWRVGVATVTYGPRRGRMIRLFFVRLIFWD